MKERRIEGTAEISGNAHFCITITDPAYSVRRVKEMLRNDHLQFSYGNEDTSLTTPDGHEVGMVAWSENDLDREAFEFWEE